MAITPQGHRVIGIRYFAKELRGEGLLVRGQYYPDQAAAHIRDRGAARVQRWVNRILSDVAKVLRTGKLSQRLRDGEIVVRVGHDLVRVPIRVPREIVALERREHRSGR